MEAGYKKLIVWQKSVELVKEIYFITAKFPKEEMFGVTSQMRRAAFSIPSNIAEGSRRKTNDRVQFLRVAFGSATELEAQLAVVRLLPFGIGLDLSKVDNLLLEVLKMLSKMVHY